MNNIINLNKVRKTKARIEKDKLAAENRHKFGRTKQEKQNAEKNKTKLDNHVNDHQLEHMAQSTDSKAFCNQVSTGWPDKDPKK